jgi:acetyl esterase/lipase
LSQVRLMIELERSRPGMLMRRSLRSYVVNATMRMLVKPRFKSPPMSADEMRAFMVAHIEPRARYLDGVPVREASLAGFDARWIEPEESDQGSVILYLHGGAFVVETPKAHTAFLTHLCSASGVPAVMPSYRLAPEHPYPAAVDDCLAAYKSLLESGYDPGRIAFAGDSAGGNLAMVTMQQLRDAKLPLPGCCVMISPGMDLSGTASHTENAKRDPMFNEHALAAVIAHYLHGDFELTNDPRVSPLKGSFEDLPPLYFVAGSTEIFRDCSIYATHKAKQAGVNAHCDIWSYLPHCFPVMFQGLLPEAGDALADIASFIRAHVIRANELPQVRESA